MWHARESVLDSSSPGCRGFTTLRPLFAQMKNSDAASDVIRGLILVRWLSELGIAGQVFHALQFTVQCTGDVGAAQCDLAAVSAGMA